MGDPARKHEDLITWQPCRRLRGLVFEYTREGPAAHGYDYRRQLRTAVRSACYNTSEGFIATERRQFGHFRKVAYVSLGEALDQIDERPRRTAFTPAST